MNRINTALILLMIPFLLKAQQIKVDGNVEHQTIDGFGGMNHTTWVKDFNDDQRQKIFGNEPGNMGLSILRIHIDPNSGRFKDHLPTAKFAQEHGAKIFATPWDPPSNLLENNGDDTYIPESNYGAYLNHLNSFDAFMKDNGVPLYAISVQNEPDIGEWAGWTPAQIFKFVKEYAQHINNKVIAPESFHFDWKYSDPILKDSTASSHVDIIGGHIYGGGLKDYPLARQKGKPVWMTEHLTGHESPEVNTWPLALSLAKEINDCMLANFNAYVWWYIRRYYSLITDDGNISHKGYVMSHFSKFVRPNAIRIDAVVSSVPNVYATAYKTDTSLTVVAINRNAINKQIQLSVNNVNFEQLTAFTSTNGTYLKNTGTLIESDGMYTVTLPPYSISTFTSTPQAGGKFNNIFPVAYLGDEIQTINDEDLNGIEKVVFDASECYDPDGEIMNYSWAYNGEQISVDTVIEMELPVGTHTLTLTVTDNDGARDIEKITVNVESTFTTELWFEAECANVGLNWELGYHDEASNTTFVNSPEGIEFSGFASEIRHNQIAIPFSVLEEGNYKIWGRVITPSADDDSFWIKLDKSAWIPWNGIPTGDSWHWDDVHNVSDDQPVSFYLRAGNHTLYVGIREDGALLDKILIANTGLVPTGLGGDAESCNAITRTTKLWFEAECMNVGSTWEQLKDDEASNQGYVTTPEGTENTSSASSDTNDQLNVTFNITEPGLYKVWGRVITSNGNDDSFWVKMDENEWINWNQIPTGNSWHWDDVHDGGQENNVKFNLTTGKHTLYISFREDGALLDKLLITNADTIPVALGGEAESCNLVGVNNMDNNRQIIIYPNPTEHKLNIFFPELRADISIYTINGIEIYSAKNLLSKTEIDILDYNPGIYFVKIENEHQTVIKKVIKK